MAGPPSILVAHKDALARAYLRGIIGRMPGSAPCREAVSFNDAAELLSNNGAFTLALIDIDLPGMASDLGLRFFATHYRQTRIVALVPAPGDRTERLEAAGLAGAVPKDLPEALLARAINLILHGEHYRPPADTRASAAAAPSPREPSPGNDHELTGRQSEVLRLLALGRSNREIGHVLNIAEGTVKVHVNAAFRVLGVHNRVSAAAALRKRFEEPLLEHHARLET